MTAGALAGIRVLDLGIITAGAATSAILADLGADVIKIEAPDYADPFRIWAGATGESPVFRATNRGKRGLSLNLKNARGREIFLDLLAHSDVVVENFRRGVLQSLDLAYPVLRERNPGVVLASISSQGEDGPLARYVSFGTTLEAMSGMAALGGYEDGTPAASGVDMNYPDQVVSLFAAGMILSAVVERERTGNGAHLDLSQRELASFMCGESFAEAPGRARRVEGADGIHAIQRCFRAADGRWVAVSVLPKELARLRALLGDTDEAALADWIGANESALATRELQDAGLTAERVLTGIEAGADALSAGSMAMQRLPDGFVAKGFAFNLRDKPLAILGDAPCPGAHSDTVLSEILGWTPSEIARAKAVGAVGSAN